MKKVILTTITIGVLSACTPAPEPVQAPLETPVDSQYCVPGVSCNRAGIEDDPNKIVLSDESQSEQERSRALYAERQQQIAAERVEITTAVVPETPTVNVVQYARETTNAVGVSIYSRPGSGTSKCRNYSSADAAQRAFLENGGPVADPLNLDKDGDGFACKFNPTIYRNLTS